MGTLSTFYWTDVMFSFLLDSTADPGNHQDIFHITLCFSSVWYGQNVHNSKSNYQKIFHLALLEKNHFLQKCVAYATQCRVCNTRMSHMQHCVAYATHMCRICNTMLHMRHAIIAYAAACCARDMC